MKVKDQEAIRKEGARIFSDNLPKLRFNPTKRWHRIKAKILGAGWRIRATRHDNEILKNMEKKFHELNEAIEEGYYYIEVTLDDAGINPLPCPLCKGEKKIPSSDGIFFGLIPLYIECPMCNGSGYKPALTKGEEKLLKDSIQLNIPHP